MCNLSENCNQFQNLLPISASFSDPIKIKDFIKDKPNSLWNLAVFENYNVIGLYYIMSLLEIE